MPLESPLTALQELQLGLRDLCAAARGSDARTLDAWIDFLVATTAREVARRTESR
jgi:hypothetical protein